MDQLRDQYLMVAIETDATRYHGEGAGSPKLLDRNAAEQVLAHLSSDLSSLFPRAGEFSIGLAGALYDQSQVLSPGYPIFKTLARMLAAETRSAAGRGRLLSIGADDGRMPATELQPASNITPGILQILPLVARCEASVADDLFDQMEHRFLEEGQLSPHSAQALAAHFDIGVNHARFMTLADLSALLRLQLENMGFGPLWELLDVALENHTDSLEVQNSSGARFQWIDGVVQCRFETFDFWANSGSGQDVPAENLAAAYRLWLREYRQTLLTLEGHGVTVSQHLPGTDGEALQGSFFFEESRHEPDESAAGVTEQACPELGTIAITVIEGGNQLNGYPIRPRGSDELHRAVRQRGLVTGGLAFPGEMRVDHEHRCLVPDLIA